jgi:hypothetical protein
MKLRFKGNLKQGQQKQKIRYNTVKDSCSLGTINKPAKVFLRNCFQIRYAEKIASQMEENPSQFKPVDLKLSVYIALGSKMEDS